MAIDPRISLTPAPTVNVGQRVAQNLANIQAFDAIQQNREQAPIRNRLMELQLGAREAQQPQLLQQISEATSPEAQLARQQEQAANIARNYALSAKPLIDANNMEGLKLQLERSKQQALDLGIDASGIDEDLLQIQTPEGFEQFKREVESALLPQAREQRVTASRILDDGTTIQSLSTGGTNVISPQGELLTGEAREQALDEALRTKVEQKGDIAQAVSDVKVGELKRIEEETEKGKQEVAKRALEIDETKIKNDKERTDAINTKNARRKEADNATLVISELLDGDAFSSAFGRFNNFPPEGFRTQANIDARAQVDQVVGLLSLESRQKLKGQGTITDSEAKTLAQSATILTNPLISDDVARKELRRVRRIFEDASDRNRLKQETLRQNEQQPVTVIRFDAEGNIIQ